LKISLNEYQTWKGNNKRIWGTKGTFFAGLEELF
jgi:hypothetical protein